MNDLSRGTALEPRPYRTLDIFSVVLQISPEMLVRVAAFG
jgi:hypothetical protein